MTPDQERRTTMRYLLVKALPVVAALLLWAVATPADAAWYLMAPPPTKEELFYRVDEHAPLSRWQQFTVHDTASECQSARLILMRTDPDNNGLGSAAEQLSRLAFLKQQYSWALCVSSDDPRLVSAPASKSRAAEPDANAGKFGFKITIPIPESDRDRAPNLTWGMGVIRYTPGRPIVAVVRLNGRSSARLILDTGADGSMVKPELLAAAGVDLARPAGRVKMSGVTGKVEVSYFPVDFEVAGHRARVLRVAAFYDENDIADGLLGRDFLDRFKVVMDPAAGTVTLVPR